MNANTPGDTGGTRYVIASLKHAQDGVALAWGVNDARFQPTYRWADPVRGGAVIVEVQA